LLFLIIAVSSPAIHGCAKKTQTMSADLASDSLLASNPVESTDSSLSVEPGYPDTAGPPHHSGGHSHQHQMQSHHSGGSSYPDSVGLPPLTIEPDEELPQFPWPPPRPTLRSEVPRGLLIHSDHDSLGQVFDRLKATLTLGDFDLWSVYAVGNTGFAVVCRLEHIMSDGRRGDPPFSKNPPPSEGFNLREYVHDLFSSDPGRYRVIVLVARPGLLHGYSAPPVESMMTGLAAEGGADITSSLRSRPVTGVRIEALIYEFYRPNQNVDPRVVPTGETALTAAKHLVGAKLWRAEDLR